MNIAHVPQRIEIALWEAVLPVLKTSPAAANLVLGCYSFFRRYQSFPYPLRVAAWGIAGLLVGFLAGLLFSPLAGIL